MVFVPITFFYVTNTTQGKSRTPPTESLTPAFSASHQQGRSAAVAKLTKVYRSPPWEPPLPDTKNSHTTFSPPERNLTNPITSSSSMNDFFFTLSVPFVVPGS